MRNAIESFLNDYGVWFLIASIVAACLTIVCHLRLRRLRKRARLAQRVEDTLVDNAQGLILSMHGIVDELDPKDRTRERTEQALDQADRQLSSAREKIEDLRAPD